MAAVNLQKVTVDKTDPLRATAQLELAHNKLVQDLTYLLRNLDDQNFTQTFLAQLQGGGTP